MKKIILLMSIVLFSCNNKSPELINAEKKLEDSKKKTAEMELDLINGIFTDEIDYSKADCENLIETRKDKMTDKTLIQCKSNSTAGLIKINKNKYKIPSEYIEISSYLDKNKIVIVFNCKSIFSCIDDKDKVIMLFDDNEKIEIINQSEYNCDGKIVAWLSKDSKKIKDLSTKKVKTIRAQSNGKYIDLDFIDNEAYKLKNTLACISKK